eukprot:CAMPEP_0203870446 /NCGR_PEP_ID=MMETSP0359-20131031/18239_1 /ASSEMBLY_ACC=CAM_ASM_000338 /TAXON_ID=268821 /ORGANISM="Scrippsiella Hangoei, Strain SHTV-5" /LENGTH=657 /DNA_ID=CAMNT_0050789113 /DNA_START=106 /DNA_END=2079 /DNA_ORIENTATION=-
MTQSDASCMAAGVSRPLGAMHMQTQPLGGFVPRLTPAPMQDTPGVVFMLPSGVPNTVPAAVGGGIAGGVGVFRGVSAAWPMAGASFPYSGTTVKGVAVAAPPMSGPSMPLPCSTGPSPVAASAAWPSMSMPLPFTGGPLLAPTVGPPGLLGTMVGGMVPQGVSPASAGMLALAMPPPPLGQVPAPVSFGAPPGATAAAAAAAGTPPAALGGLAPELLGPRRWPGAAACGPAGRAVQSSRRLIVRRGVPHPRRPGARVFGRDGGMRSLGRISGKMSDPSCGQHPDTPDGDDAQELLNDADSFDGELSSAASPLEDLLLSVPRGLTQNVVAPPILVWRCKHSHGLFSMFSLALGHALTCEQKGWALIVDWSGDELLYKGPPGEPNLWHAFFQQPAALVCPPSVLLQALRQGRFMETDKNEVAFGGYRGAIQGFGSIPPAQAAQGRALVRRHVALREAFAQRLQGMISTLLGGGHQWLAVHIRRGDKATEAAANFLLGDEDLLLRIVVQCAAWRCTGVFLCTDDPGLKTRLRSRLEASPESGGAGLAVSLYPSALSSLAGQGTHFDKSLDCYKKAEDVMVETLLMARGCHGLISTYSNVSAAVVYLSPPGYLYSTFWDPVESCGIDQAVEDTMLSPPPTCSMEAGSFGTQGLLQALACAK